MPVGMPLANVDRECLGNLERVPLEKMVNMNEDLMLRIGMRFSMEEIVKAESLLGALATQYHILQKPCERFNAILHTYNYHWNARFSRRFIVILVALNMARKLIKIGEDSAAAGSSSGKAGQQDGGSGAGTMTGGGAGAVPNSDHSAAQRRRSGGGWRKCNDYGGCEQCELERGCCSDFGRESIRTACGRSTPGGQSLHDALQPSGAECLPRGVRGRTGSLRRRGRHEGVLSEVAMKHI